MATESELKTEIEAILRTKWQKREGQQVPEKPDAVKLGNDAISLDGAVLYADLIDSTRLVDKFYDWFAAAVFKAYLSTACRIIKDNGGAITAFDGDRVMAVFLGATKNTSAVRAALRINYAVQSIINPTIKRVYPNTSFELQQSIGVDVGPLFVARTGIRGSNDLVWIGRAANYAAKLCSLREESFTTFITEDVHQKLHDSAKMGGDPKRSMWEKVIWKETGLAIYRSTWWWTIA
jgi:class 3 adenylate cyclase